jgi:signal transduction histidine kinase
MSHEIRTPMTSISGFVDLLTTTGRLTSPQPRYIDLVKTANAALLTIVNDIRDFSKIGADKRVRERQPPSPSRIGDGAAFGDRGERSNRKGRQMSSSLTLRI